MTFLKIGKKILNVNAIAYIEWEPKLYDRKEVCAIVYTFATVATGRIDGYLRDGDGEINGSSEADALYITDAEVATGLWRYFHRPEIGLVNVKHLPRAVDR